MLRMFWTEAQRARGTMSMNSDAPTVLAQLRRLGARVTTTGESLHVESPVMLPVTLQVDARLHKAEILALLQAEAQEEYRQVFRRILSILAAGPDASVDDCKHFVREEVRLAAGLGRECAGEIRQAEGQASWQETGRCPHCGEAGELHAPISGAAGNRGPRAHSPFRPRDAAPDATP